MIAVVCPSNRPESLERWRRAWKAEFEQHNVRVYEILDEPETWLTIKQELGEDSWIIPRKTDCIRSYGFWQAWQDGADIVWTLDDDCYPYTSNIKGAPPAEAAFDGHLENLDPRNDFRWATTISDLPPRGLPRGWAQPQTRRTVISHGLWLGVPDLDAETQLATPTPYEYSTYNFCVDPGTYFPMSGMNLCFRRSILPAMFFGLQGTHLWNDQPWGFDRFGDIWCGLFAKKICDHLRLNVHSGGACVSHERASDPHVNLVKEAPGKAVNEWLWESVDAVNLTKHDVVGCYRELADKIDLPDEPYWHSLKRAMHIWSDLYS